MAKQSVDPFEILAQQNQALQKPAKKKKSGKPKVFDTLFSGMDDESEDDELKFSSSDDFEVSKDNFEDKPSSLDSEPRDETEYRPADEVAEDAGINSSADASEDDAYLMKMQKMQELYAHNADNSDAQNARRSTGRRGRPPKPSRFEGGSRSALKMTEENAKHLKIMASRMMITQSEYMEKLIHKEKLLAGTDKDLRPLDLDRYDLGYFNVQRSIFFTKADDEFLKERQAYLVVSRTRYLNYLLKMDQL